MEGAWCQAQAHAGWHWWIRPSQASLTSLFYAHLLYQLLSNIYQLWSPSFCCNRYSKRLGVSMPCPDNFWTMNYTLVIMSNTKDYFNLSKWMFIFLNPVTRPKISIVSFFFLRLGLSLSPIPIQKLCVVLKSDLHQLINHSPYLREVRAETQAKTWSQNCFLFQILQPPDKKHITSQEEWQKPWRRMLAGSHRLMLS